MVLLTLANVHFILSDSDITIFIAEKLAWRAACYYELEVAIHIAL
jgi:hypothetical protein